MVPAAFLVELRQEALADGVGMGRLAEVGPFCDGGIPGRVRRRHEVDLAVPVQGEVDGCAQAFVPVAQDVVDEVAAALLGVRLVEAAHGGPQHVDPVDPAQVPLVGEGAQQVVGGGQGDARLPGQLLGGSAAFVEGRRLQQPQRPLDGADECGRGMAVVLM